MELPSFEFQNLGEVFSLPPQQPSKNKQDKKEHKRGLNGYLLFCKERRTILQAEHPKETSREVTKLLGQEWKELSAEERKKFEDRSKAENDQKENSLNTINAQNNTIYLQISTMDGKILAIPAIQLNKQ